MAVVEVTARQFKENPNCFFEQIDNGNQIVLKRGRKQKYSLVPVDDELGEDDFVVTPELLLKIENARQQMREGKYTECKTIEELHHFLDSL